MSYTVGVWVQSTLDSSSDRPPMVIHRNVGLGDLAGLAGAEGTDLRCALPLDMSPRIRRRVLAEIERTDGITLTAAVEAPVAAFAALPPGPTARLVPSGGPQLHAVVLGQPGGSISILVADRISAQLTGAGVVQDHVAARQLLRRAFLACLVTSGFDEDSEAFEELVEDHYASVTAYQLDGAGSDLVDHAFGHVPVERRPLRSVDACLLGLSRLSRLAFWTTTWPTGRVHLGSGWTRHAGPLEGDGETHLVRLRTDRVLRFSDSTGEPVPVRAGSVRAWGCHVPERLGAQPRLQILDDGRILIHGPAGVAPLAARLQWPIPGSGSTDLAISSAGRLGLELIDPSVVRPEQIEDVEPQLGGQPQ